MSLIHVGIMLSLGHVALFPSLCMSSSPLHYHCVLYPGCLFIVVMCCILVTSSFHVSATLSSSSQVLLLPCLCHPCISWSCRPCVSWSCHSCAVASLSCVFLASAVIVLVPCCWPVVMLCVSKVGWDEWRGYSPGCLVITCVHLQVLAIICEWWGCLCSFLGVLHHLGLCWWLLWLMTWCCHVAVGCSIVGCMPWL